MPSRNSPSIAPAANRLTRTVWRGVRFWMTGSGLAYAWRAFWWGALVLLTLGLAYPFDARPRLSVAHGVTRAAMIVIGVTVGIGAVLLPMVGVKVSAWASN